MTMKCSENAEVLLALTMGFHLHRHIQRIRPTESFSNKVWPLPSFDDHTLECVIMSATQLDRSRLAPIAPSCPVLLPCLSECSKTLSPLHQQEAWQ